MQSSPAAKRCVTLDDPEEACSVPSPFGEELATADGDAAGAALALAAEEEELACAC